MEVNWQRVGDYEDIVFEKSDDGIAKLQAAVQSNPNSGAAHQNLASYLLKSGAADEALLAANVAEGRGER